MKSINNVNNTTIGNINTIIAKAPLYDCEGGGYEALGQNGNVTKYLAGERKGKVFIGNAFSLQMVADNAIIAKVEVSPEEIPTEAVSIIGHTDTAAVVGSILGRNVPCNRASVMLDDEDTLYVAQVVGGRLHEGATTIPDGMEIKFYRITVRT